MQHIWTGKRGDLLRLNVVVHGAVQGVGFRPHTYRLAREMNLNGWVLNSSQGVFIEVEGREKVLRPFLNRLETEKPRNAKITSIESRFLQPTGYQGFEIRRSNGNGDKSALILPDAAVCPDCLHDLFNKKDRRFRYPFINCTNCGPRFSIIEALPYDRPNTTMKLFKLCPECQAEYEDPTDRRFHAQPTACPRCGPKLQFWTKNQYHRNDGPDSMKKAEDAVREGKILALKGIGGFQLIVDARNENAVMRLRRRKGRSSKPFAIMCPNIEYVRGICHVSEQERTLLESPEAPIVLLKKRSTEFDWVARGVNDYGVMLPYSPLHHILMKDLDFPVVATSGNRSEEPICTENLDAFNRLSHIADAFLVHDRPIARHVDDSIVRVLLGKTQVLRRARGYAPLPIDIKRELPDCLAVGAHLKNTVSLGSNGYIFTSQHIGDLETAESYHAFEAATRDLPHLYDCKPQVVVRDKHPDYLSTHYARTCGLKTIKVQHHLAHVYACMADNNLDPPTLGVSWDGTGLGDDGSTWGGEFFSVGESLANRVASIRQFPLLGGDMAARQPRRSALALLYATFPRGFEPIDILPSLSSFTRSDRHVLHQIYTQTDNPMTSSMGRLFDAVSSLLGLCQVNEFEGQAAMLLETAATQSTKNLEPYSLKTVRKKDLLGSNLWILDWRTTIKELTLAYLEGEQVEDCALRFHKTLVAWIVDIARRAKVPNVALTGGCFQNRLLCELAAPALKKQGFKVHFHQNIPPNDGGISVGQAYAASRHFSNTIKSEKK